MINIEIDGKKIIAEQGAMIIEAADNAGIYIPRFCYHKKLSIAANCRMCLIDVEKSPKPVPACATPVNEGMQVFTKSPRAIEAQKYVMEFLLVNHPLDCPICDQGGECELQDLSMGFGRGDSVYLEAKRAVHDDDLGPLIATEMTRCIHCTRCVRFGVEVAGVAELGMTNRGENSQITTYIKHALTSELSGNIIDLCPVGALTSKPYRFSARAWELTQKPSIAAHDCVGSNINLHTRNGSPVMRVVPRDNEAINETWISDRDRFSYLGLQHSDRLKKPMIKHQGQWQEVDWTKAFEYAAKGLKEIIRAHSAEQIGALISPTATTEEAFLFQKILRTLDINNVDYRLQQTDFADYYTQSLTLSAEIKFKELSEQDCILLIGSNITREQPIMSNHVRSATRNDGRVVCVNPVDFSFPFPVTAKTIVHPHLLITELAGIANVLGAAEAAIPKQIKQGVMSVTPSENAQRIGKELQNGTRKTIILGALALNHPQASQLRSLVKVIAQLCQAKLLILTSGPNSAGAEFANAKPQASALNAASMWQQKLKAYLLFAVEPEFDCANPGLTQAALEQAGFVIAFTAYQSKALAAHADILFPIVPFAENEGTYVNAQHDWQSFKAVAPTQGDARPGWKVLRVFANMLELDNFQYINVEEILTELHAQIANKQNHATSIYDTQLTMSPPISNLTRISEWPLYRSDSVVRRAAALQACGANESVVIRINQTLAAHYGFKEDDMLTVTQNNHSINLPLKIDEAIPDACVYLATAYAETEKLGAAFGEIKVVKL